MNQKTRRAKYNSGHWFSLAASLAVLLTVGAGNAKAQLLLNEANAVGIGTDSYIEADTAKPYEGYDYGVLPHSGNNEPPYSANPGDTLGNPFPADVDTGTAGNQTTLPNGWTGMTGWARIKYNGGDWMELVVTEDHTDLRGWTLYWENNDNNFGIGFTADDRGFIKMTNDPVWANLRAGTIITLSEDSYAYEIRDGYPLAPEFSYEHDTGYAYDLRTNTGFDPFDGNNDWHIHFHVDEDYTDDGIATRWFEGYSDIKVDNDDWRMAIFDASNTTLADQVNQVASRDDLDLTTGLVGGFVGESAAGWGGGGVNNQEVITYRGDPSGTSDVGDYEDVDFSTFGTPNLYNNSTETTLDGVQDFSGIRNPVIQNTHDWVGSGTANFGSTSSWEKADDNTTPTAGPNTLWTARLSNDTGVAKTAQVLTNTTVDFVTVEGSSSEMTLEVASGATLTVDGSDQQGRILVYGGGTLAGGGTFAASIVELFEGGKIAPGSSTGTLSIDGDLVMNEGSLLEIDLAVVGTTVTCDQLALSGDLSLAGTLQIVFNGTTFPIPGSAFTFLTFDSVTGDFDEYLGLDIGSDSPLEVVFYADHADLVMSGLLPGDANGNGTVDGSDATILANYWQHGVGMTTPDATWSMGDFNGDHVVDGSDATLLASYWQCSTSGGAPTAVPEPTAVVLALFGGLALLAVRRLGR